MKKKNKIPLNHINCKESSPESNGIINPAFLSTPNSEESTPHHRNNHFDHNWTNNHNNGIETQASSWVYNFNHMESPERMSLPSHRRFDEYPETDSRHITYAMDLNKEYERSESLHNSRKCCHTVLRLFIWSIILVSLLGIAISIAFIIYIEKFTNPNDGVVYLPKSTNITENNFDQSIFTTDSILYNISDSNNITSKTLTFINGSDSTTISSTNFSYELNNSLNSTQMSNNTAFNSTQIPTNIENGETDNTTRSHFDKSLFNSSEVINRNESNTNISQENFTNETNKKVSILSSTTTTATITPTTTPTTTPTITPTTTPTTTSTTITNERTTPIKLQLNDSINNNNDTNTTLNESDLTTETVLLSNSPSSNLLLLNSSNFNTYTDYSDLTTNESLDPNLMNTTTYNE